MPASVISSNGGIEDEIVGTALSTIEIDVTELRDPVGQSCARQPCRHRTTPRSGGPRGRGQSPHDVSTTWCRRCAPRSTIKCSPLSLRSTTSQPGTSSRVIGPEPSSRQRATTGSFQAEADELGAAVGRPQHAGVAVLCIEMPNDDTRAMSYSASGRRCHRSRTCLAPARPRSCRSRPRRGSPTRPSRRRVV